MIVEITYTVNGSAIAQTLVNERIIATLRRLAVLGDICDVTVQSDDKEECF